MVAIIAAEEEGAPSSLRERGQGGVCVGLLSLGEPLRESWGEQAKGRLAKYFSWPLL